MEDIQEHEFNTVIADKRSKLVSIKDECLDMSVKYSKMSTRLKKMADAFEILISVLGTANIGLIVSGLTIPPLLIGGAISSGISFVLSQIYRSSRINYKIERYDITSKQYNELARHIMSVMSKNNLTATQYSYFLDEINMQISFIADAQI